MTEPLFFDNDCISAFLWVEKQSIIARLYPGRIIIPKPVYDELSFPGVQHLKQRIDQMVAAGQARIMTIQADSSTYALFLEMTQKPKKPHMVIGNGEAACLALAKEHDGIVASNNLRDISDYVKPHTTKVACFP